MSRSDIIRYLIFSAVVILLQALLFKRLYFGWSGFNYVHFFVYPLIFIVLPFRVSRAGLVIIGFVTGMLVDFFYNSPGVHTSASVFSCFIRPYVLSILEPRKGYNVSDSPVPKYLGMNWYLLYSAIIMFLHLFFYFAVETFTFYYFGEIWLKTIFSFIFSMIIILMYAFVSQAVR